MICSRNTSCPEVAGRAALFVDEADAKDIAAALARVLTDEPLRRELIRKGEERAALFSWNRTMDTTWKGLERAVSGRSTGAGVVYSAREPSPLITVVTPSYNQGRFIRATIHSVLSQDYPNVEYIIMDGGSTDETAAVVSEYASRVRWISEKDRGQSHAINKGFRMAKGELVSWLNSDDVILPDALRRAARAFQQNPGVGAVYGEGYQIDINGHVRQTFPCTEPFNLWKLIYLSDYILQQSSYFRKEVLEEVGYLDENLHYALDWDLFIRIGKLYELGYIRAHMGSIREYADAKSFAGGAKRFAELARMLRRHTGMRYPPGYWVYGLDTYIPIWCKQLEASLPAPLARLGQYAIRFTGGNLIAQVSQHSQGLYADRWAGPKLKYMLSHGRGRVSMRGVLPELAPVLRDQEIEVTCNGKTVGSSGCRWENFISCSRCRRQEGASTFVVRASRSIMPALCGVERDYRRLSYRLESFLDGVVFATAGLVLLGIAVIMLAGYGPTLLLLDRKEEVARDRDSRTGVGLLPCADACSGGPVFKRDMDIHPHAVAVCGARHCRSAKAAAEQPEDQGIAGRLRHLLRGIGPGRLAAGAGRMPFVPGISEIRTRHSTWAMFEGAQLGGYRDPLLHAVSYWPAAPFGVFFGAGYLCVLLAVLTRTDILGLHEVASSGHGLRDSGGNVLVLGELPEGGEKEGDPGRSDAGVQQPDLLHLLSRIDWRDDADCASAGISRLVYRDAGDPEYAHGGMPGPGICRNQFRLLRLDSDSGPAIRSSGSHCNGQGSVRTAGLVAPCSDHCGRCAARVPCADSDHDPAVPEGIRKHPADRQPEWSGGLLSFAFALTEQYLPFFWGLIITPLQRNSFQPPALIFLAVLSFAALLCGLLLWLLLRRHSDIPLHVRAQVMLLVLAVAYFILRNNGYGAFKLAAWLTPLTLSILACGILPDGSDAKYSLWNRFRYCLIAAVVVLNLLWAVRLGMASLNVTSIAGKSMAGFSGSDFADLSVLSNSLPAEARILVAIPDAVVERWVLTFLRRSNVSTVPFLSLSAEETDAYETVAAAGGDSAQYVLTWSGSRDITAAPRTAAVWSNSKFQLVPRESVSDLLIPGRGWYAREELTQSPEPWQHRFRWLRSKGELLLLNPSGRELRLRMTVVSGAGDPTPGRVITFALNGQRFDQVDTAGITNLVTKPFRGEGFVNHLTLSLPDGAQPIPRQWAMLRRWVPKDRRRLNVAVANVELITEDEYRRTEFPCSLDLSRADAWNTPGLGGIFGDQWIAGKAHVLLAPCGESDAVTVQGSTLETAGQQLPVPIEVSVDGVVQTIEASKPGPFHIAVPLPAGFQKTGRHEILVGSPAGSVAVHSGGPDPRSLSIRLDKIEIRRKAASQ